MWFVLAYQCIPVLLFIVAFFMRREQRRCRKLILAAIAAEAVVVCFSVSLMPVYALWNAAIVVDPPWFRDDASSVDRAKNETVFFWLLVVVGVALAGFIWLPPYVRR